MEVRIPGQWINAEGTETKNIKNNQYAVSNGSKISLFDFFSAFETSRKRQIIDIQHDIAIMGGREVSRPYRVWFFAEGERMFILGGCGDAFRHR